MPPDAPVSTCDTDFSGMGIYIDGRVKNELDELLGTKPASDLTARDVHLIASMHYLDDQPMLRAAEFFGLTAKEDGRCRRCFEAERGRDRLAERGCRERDRREDHLGFRRRVRGRRAVPGE